MDMASLAQSDILTIRTNQRELSGWMFSNVTRSLENFPSTFVISLTEVSPEQASKAVVIPGATCEIVLGADLVLTGYIDAYQPSYSGRFHTVTIHGRSKPQDILDGSYRGENSWHFNAAGSLRSVIEKIIAKTGIQLVTPNGDITVPNALIDVTPGMTYFNVIEEIARCAQVLVYDDENGNLVMGNAVQCH